MAENYDKKSKYKIWKFRTIDFFPKNGILIACNIDINNDLVINITPLDICTKIIIKKKIDQIVNNINFIKIHWDNIFIINLLRRTDRKEQMIKKLNEVNITKYEFINAFDGQDPELNNKFIELKNKHNISINTSGHFCCLLSHIKAIKLAKKLKYKNIMILEDDIFFNNNFINHISNIIIPEFDILYLGGIISKLKMFFNDGWAYGKTNKIMGAYGYILSSTIYDDVLNKLEKLNDYLDIIYIKSIQSKYKTIILNDIIKTDLSSSDTSNKSIKLVKRLDYINKNFIHSL